MISSSFLRLMSRTQINLSNCGFLSRSLQCLNSNHSRMLTNISVSQEKEKENFHNMLPIIVDSLIASPKFKKVPEISSWVKKLLEYNLSGGKKNRGLTTVVAYEAIEKPENITEESLRQARILGWCVEMLQAYFLVSDDIMDGSTMRRGLPCWYTLPDVGLGAINDSIFLYTSIFELLSIHFANSPYYTDLHELFTETLFLTATGQNLDYSMGFRHKNDYSLFTIERYLAIVRYKTAYYTYKLPVCLGLILAGNTDKNTHAKVEDICMDIGEIFQMQDDFMDCFSDETVTGKTSTDIQEGKCGWLAVVALQRCNSAQRKVFTACYGSREPAHVERIKRLYEELKLPQLYAEQERAYYDAIVEKAKALPPPLTSTLFLRLLHMIYKRKQ